MSSPNDSQPNILIIDDNPVNLRILAKILKTRDYKVHEATDGPGAIALAHQVQPDLILLDISMPEMDGYEVCSILKSESQFEVVPIIFISAFTEVVDKVKAFELGGIDYITKPFRAEEVLARVSAQLTVYKRHKSLKQQIDSSHTEPATPETPSGPPVAVYQDILPGYIIDNKYLLEKKIGSGGFGYIFQAVHTQLSKVVAIKIFRPLATTETSTAMERLRREGISACRVDHPNAVSVIDFGISKEGIPYLVMELLKGYTLGEELAQKGRLSLKRCAEIILPVCDVLSTAHELGIIHRDIKPDNIFLHQSLQGEVVKVVDFGIAKLLDTMPELGAGKQLSQDSFLGTPQFMAPERLRSRPYDGRSDVYSIGLLCYLMLSGELAFESDEGPLVVAMMQITKDAKPITEINPQIPPKVAELIHKAMSKNIHNRPTARDFAQALAREVGIKFEHRSNYNFRSLNEESADEQRDEASEKTIKFDEQPS